MPVENQIAVIYAVSKGLTDDIEVDKIREFEKGFLSYLASSEYKTSVLEPLRTEGLLTDEVESALKEAIESFKVSFLA